ncbi:MAG: DoxX family protein [Elusimicrobia bacterium]|nr:DoxX family protein [Elusimicrobiota bacterium]
MGSWGDKLSVLGLLWIRLLMGAGIAYHGYGKVFGGRMDQFAEGVARMGFPAPEMFAWAAAVSELAGGLLIVLGFKTRAAASLVFVVMSVAAFVHHGQDPFKMKELALAYWTVSGALALTGGGRASLDELF